MLTQPNQSQLTKENLLGVIIGPALARQRNRNPSMQEVGPLTEVLASKGYHRGACNLTGRT